MRTLRYTPRSVAQIDRALAYVAAESPRGASNIRARVLTILTMLRERPAAGRPTSRALVRRVVVTPYPYVLDYRVTATEIVVLRFRPAARRPPN
ncbi:type II toxin-antitoxin system RelE/ParE family toxin [Methylocystis sp. SC2]|uniref:type II toxin-antitoxin system RelE/ParE family toxin n=1 Tax=Methylocystis sp. (strain SC2) TaxID=187303 RepID=UPI00027AEE29|nr:type II toxin-antitoxin system RelE/ParE family toxin [Methylocystis sp. SC2]CCJ06377.1 Plasmid stabilization system protein [Methylocystis sp. SC2]